MRKFIVTLEVYDDDDSQTAQSVWEAVYRSIGNDFPLAFEMTVEEGEVRMGKAKEEARKMLAGLAPGNTGINLADEVAERIIAAIDSKQG